MIKITELLCPKCGHSRGGHTAVQCWADGCSCSKGWSKCNIHPETDRPLSQKEIGKLKIIGVKDNERKTP